MTCAADLRPTAAETAAALGFTTDGYSDGAGVDHVTAAVRSVAAAEAHGSEWEVAEAEYLRAVEASDDATALEVTATTDNLVIAHQPIHSAYLQARSRLMQTTAPHWAAIGAKADAFLRMWGDDETSRYAKAARRLAESAAKIGKALPDAADLIDVMSARGSAEQLCYYLAHDDDGYRNWAVSLGGVGKIASEAEAMASETRQLARANDAQLAVSAAVVGAVWFSKPPKPECKVSQLSDEWSTALRIHHRLDAKTDRTLREDADLSDAEARLGELNDEVLGHIPQSREGVAFQLLVAAGRVPHVRTAVTDEAKLTAEKNVVTAITTALRVLGLPFDYRAATYFVGPCLDDLDGRDLGGAK